MSPMRRTQTPRAPPRSQYPTPRAPRILFPGSLTPRRQSLVTGTPRFQNFVPVTSQPFQTSGRPSFAPVILRSQLPIATTASPQVAMPPGIQQGSHVPPKGYQKGSHQVTKSTITNTPQPTASSSLVATNSGSPVASSSALINNSSVNEITKKRPRPKEAELAEQSVSNLNLPTDKKITSAPAGDPSNKSEREDPSPMKLRKRNDSADTELREFDFSVAHRLLNRHNLELSSKDIASLGGQQFLNDNIVDYWLSEFLSSKLTPDERERTHVFSAWFYKRLTSRASKKKWENDPSLSSSRTRHQRVKKWTKGVDLFSKDFVIVPICEDLHWMVAIICFPGLNGIHNESGTKKLPYRNIDYPIHQNGKKGRAVLTATAAQGREGADVSQPDENPGQPIIKQPCILMFDSLRSDSSSAQIKIFTVLRSYLEIEHTEKKGMRRDFTRLNFPGYHPVVPQQPNHCDGGIYLLSYVEAFFTRPIKSYWLPIQNLEEWFASSTVHTKRKETYEAIIAIIKAEAPENVKYIPQLTFHEGSESSEEESGKDKKNSSNLQKRKTQ